MGRTRIIGSVIVGGLGGLLLLEIANNVIQGLQYQLNRRITPLENDLNRLKTNVNQLANDLKQLKQKQERLATQLKQTEDNLQLVSTELQGRLELFGQLQQSNEILFEPKVEKFIDPRFREIESKVTRLNTKFIKINERSLQPVTNSDSSQDSMRFRSIRFRRWLSQLPVSMTANEENSPQYVGLIPQDESLSIPSSLTASLKLDLKQQKEEIDKHIEELEKQQAKIQEELNARLAFIPPESDSAIKMNPLPKDDPGDDNGGNPGLGAGTSQVEVNYLFISNNNFNLFPNSTNLINTDKLINFNGFSSSKLIKPIIAQSSVLKPVAIPINKLNNITDYLIPKNSIKYNLNDNLDNSCINNEHQVDITIINKSSTHPELINDIKLFNIITNEGSTVYNISSIGNSNFGHRLNSNHNIQPNRIINLNKNLFKNDNLESFSIADSDINQSVVENNNIIELCNIRQILHNKWLNSRLTSYPLIKDDFNQSLIEDIVDIKLTDDVIPIINQTNDLTKTSIVTSNLKIKQYIDIKNTNNTLCLNNNSLYIKPIFVSHALYIDFLDLIYCELFFNQQIINLNVSCFIYGSIFVPSLCLLNCLAYIITTIILITNCYLINNGINRLLKNTLNSNHYSFVKNQLNKFYLLLFNTIFLYIIWLNITNVALVSNLVLLKGTTLYGGKMLTDLNKSNSEYFKENLVIHKNVFINPLIYRNKMEL